MKRALILGPGQDGSYLAEILLEQGYEVHVMHRRSSVDNLKRIRHLLDRVTLHRGDLTDFGSLLDVFAEADPQEVYNVADQDDVSWSYSIKSYAWDVTSGGVLRVLEVCRAYSKEVRLFQPLSATMFGLSPPPQNEQTPLNPRSPFACAKAAAWHLCKHYRQDRGVWVTCGIMFNHDSPTRSEDYVLHKICKSAVRIARGEQEKLVLGSLDQQIDIGFARDYMEAAVRMMQLAEPDDFVIGTGEGTSIKSMVAIAFHCAGIGGREKEVVEVNPAAARPGPQPTLIADARKAKRVFGFDPGKTCIGDLIKMLVEHEQGMKT